MSIPALVAFKNPARAKQRLAPVLSVGERSVLACAMLAHVLQTLRAASEIGQVFVVAEDVRTRALCVRHGATFLREPMNRGYNEAITFALQEIRGKAAEGVLILASDLPLVTASEIDVLARPAPYGTVRIAVSRDGTGTNGLYLNPSHAICPAFGVGSGMRHCQSAEVMGMTAEMVRLSGLGFDIDTPTDLMEWRTLQAAVPSQFPTGRQIRIPDVPDEQVMA